MFIKRELLSCPGSDKALALTSTRLSFAVASLAALVACQGGSADRDGMVCAPGATQECVCPGAARGVQICLESGLAWGTCDCRAAATLPANPASPPIPNAPAGPAGLTLEWADLPGGTFMMGSSAPDAAPEERPPHEVQLDPFRLHRTETTVAMYAGCVAAGRCSAAGTGVGCVGAAPENDQLPVNCVTWSQARTFCEYAQARLPTEAEWEYAARAGTSGERPADVAAEAWIGGNSGGKPHLVATKQANSWGLSDLLGNVQEWVADAYDLTYYAQSPSRNPTGPVNTVFGVLRGGSYGTERKNASFTRRMKFSRSTAVKYVGFRCAAAAGQTAPSFPSGAVEGGSAAPAATLGGATALTPCWVEGHQVRCRNAASVVELFQLEGEPSSVLAMADGSIFCTVGVNVWYRSASGPQSVRIASIAGLKCRKCGDFRKLLSEESAIKLQYADKEVGCNDELCETQEVNLPMPAGIHPVFSDHSFSGSGASTSASGKYIFSTSWSNDICTSRVSEASGKVLAAAQSEGVYKDECSHTARWLKDEVLLVHVYEVSHGEGSGFEFFYVWRPGLPKLMAVMQLLVSPDEQVLTEAGIMLGGQWFPLPNPAFLFFLPQAGLGR